jgi:hypothetical protein
MSVDVTDAAGRREGRTPNLNSPDPSTMQKLTIIVSSALLFLVAVKLGFLKRVLP